MNFGVAIIALSLIAMGVCLHIWWVDTKNYFVKARKKRKDFERLSREYEEGKRG